MTTLLRHKVTGDLGRVVDRDGKQAIKVQRATKAVYFPVRTDEWEKAEVNRPLTRAHVVQVAWEADRKLCYILGDHESARKEWGSLRDEERASIIRSGPKGLTGARRDLWDMICETLTDHSL